MITQQDITRLLGREPRRNEGTFTQWLMEWLRTREQMEPESEMERRLR